VDFWPAWPAREIGALPNENAIAPARSERVAKDFFMKGSLLEKI
jgi:hypothetical protein